MAKGSGGTRSSRRVSADMASGREKEKYLSPIGSAEKPITIKKMGNGGEVQVFAVGRYNPKDYDDLKKIAKIRAKKDGVIVQILPAIDSPKDPNYKTIYAELVGTEYEGKCPDLKIITHKGGKTYVEYESYTKPFSMKKVSKMLSRGSEQSSRIIIDIRGTKVTRRGVRDRVIKLRQQKTFSKTITSVWLYDGKTIEKAI